jgi:hypothetical protein
MIEVGRRDSFVISDAKNKLVNDDKILLYTEFPE